MGQRRDGHLAETSSGSDWRPRVLVVDDSLTRRMWLKDHCEEIGCAVVVARDGNEALAKLRRTKDDQMPDVVLADHRMPGMTGDRLVERIRVSPRFRHMMTVLYSGQVEDGRAPRSVTQRQGTFSMQALLSVDAVPEALAAALERVRDLRARGVSRAEVERAASDAGDNNFSAGKLAHVTDPMPDPPEGAEQELEQIATLLELEPDNPDLLEWMAYRLYVRGHFPEAIEAYQDLYQRGHRPARQLLYLGNSHYKLGQVDEALEAWRKTVQLFPALQEARKAKARMTKAQREGAGVEFSIPPGSSPRGKLSVDSDATPLPFKVPTPDEIAAAVTRLGADAARAEGAASSPAPGGDGAGGAAQGASDPPRSEAGGPRSDAGDAS